MLVVGGGAVARRKIAALLPTGARLRVGAPALDPELAALAAEGRLEHLPGAFDASWLDGARLVIAATDDEAVNRAVADAAEARGIWVNVVDDAPLCAFQMPARVERGPLQIAISSGGAAPMLARHLRERLETELDPALGPLASRGSQALGAASRAMHKPLLSLAFSSRSGTLSAMRWVRGTVRTRWDT